MPTAVVSQTTAAVVRPRTASRRTKISPPPMNPMPDTICAAIRDGSRVTWSPSTSKKPYFDTSIISAAAMPTSVCVRKPALFCRISRSSPIAADSTSARPRSNTCVQPWPMASVGEGSAN